MVQIYKKRRLVVIILVLIVTFFSISTTITINDQTQREDNEQTQTEFLAVNLLKQLEIKTDDYTSDYDRSQFIDKWGEVSGCDMRNIILYRDLIDTILDNNCDVVSGTLNDPYTGKTIAFKRGKSTSADVQIDHVVALSDAWRKGAQKLSYIERNKLANDPLGLLAVDGEANQLKSDSDASMWLPKNKIFRCQYVARQIAVKFKYKLWVSQQEKYAISNVLDKCPNQKLPS